VFDHLIVPVDGSSASFRAVPVACRIAARLSGGVEVVTVVDRLADVSKARDMLERGIRELGPLPVEPKQLVHASHTVAGAISTHIEYSHGGMALMSAHGHGRSAAILGSTTDELLRAMFGPVIVIGPHAVGWQGRLDGNYVVPLDGSKRSDGVLPIVAAWATEFGGTPWLVEVAEDGFGNAGDLVESSFVNGRASELRRRITRPVEFEVLHADHPAREIVRFAEESNASLIFMATHGRTGFERLVSGSVAAGVIHDASCPIVMFRPPELAATRVVAFAGGEARIR
jgi:nucleotide-binding universal stress UspA family protein